MLLTVLPRLCSAPRSKLKPHFSHEASLTAWTPSLSPPAPVSVLKGPMMSYIVMSEPFDSAVNTHSLNRWFSLGQCLPPRGHLALSEDILGFPGGASGKEPACQCRRHKRCQFDSWVGKIPWRRAWQPTAVFLPGESHGQRSLVVDISMAEVWGRHLVGGG